MSLSSAQASATVRPIDDNSEEQAIEQQTKPENGQISNKITGYYTDMQKYFMEALLSSLIKNAGSYDLSSMVTRQSIIDFVLNASSIIFTPTLLNMIGIDPQRVRILISSIIVALVKMFFLGEKSNISSILKEILIGIGANYTALYGLSVAFVR